jgi:hypothetical protein
MRISVEEAVRQLEARGLITREHHDYSEMVIAHVRQLLGRPLPLDLIDFYRERIGRLGDTNPLGPVWNDWLGRITTDGGVTELLAVDAVPLFTDGCGSLFGLDITPGVEAPAVYFFDKDNGFEKANYAAGSSLGAFLLLFADSDQAYAENWPDRWELKIDPDIDKCPRAPAIWDAD